MTDELIRAARQGNRGAVAELLNRSEGSLRELALRELLRWDANDVDANDADAMRLVQRTLRIAEQEFEDFAGTTQAQYLQWLGAIFQRSVLEAGRHPGHQQENSASILPCGESTHHPRAVDSPTVLDRSSSAADGDQPLLAAIDSLPAVPRDVVRLRLLHGWTVVRMARHLGLDEVTVARLLRRGLRQLCGLVEAGGVRDT